MFCEFITISWDRSKENYKENSILAKKCTECPFCGIKEKNGINITLHLFAACTVICLTYFRKYGKTLKCLLKDCPFYSTIF